MAPAETPAGFLSITHRDLRAAMAMADSSVFGEDTWGFHLQQAIEKALKAWLLVLTPVQPPFSHNLRLLFQMLRDQGAAVEPFLGLSRFTLFAVLWQYDEEPEPENLDRAAWNRLCADLLDHMASLIP
ncbi:MAG: HEPN domain-containing protein [Synechococcaceae cyanobacterium]|nr:HEPN domain-containing protein [Synechococcaceae cyanobacterium]